MGIGDWFKRGGAEQAVGIGSESTVTQQSISIDASGVEGLQEALREVMSRYGVDSDSGSAPNLDAAQAMAMQQDVLATLAEHGLDVAAMTNPFSAFPGSAKFGISAISAAGAGSFAGDPAERLKELAELRAKGLITDEEHLAKRREILGDL